MKKIFVSTITLAVILTLQFQPLFAGYGETKLTDEIAADGDNFGFSVAISGKNAVVGSPYADNESYKEMGKVCFYALKGGEWRALPYSNPPDNMNDSILMGYDVDVDGNYAVVSAPWDDTHGEKSGTVFVYKYNGTKWTFKQSLYANDAAEDDRFGVSVAISGNYIIVGAFFDSDHGKRSGSAYIFKMNGSGDWVQQQKLTAYDARLGDWYGVEVAIHGDVAAVGSRYYDIAEVFNAGGVYIYKRDGDSWDLRNVMHGVRDDARSEVVAIADTMLAFGQYYESNFNPNAGRVVTVHFDDNFEHPFIDYHSDDTAAYDEYGGSVSLTNEIMVVGAHKDDDKGTNSGSVYVYDLLNADNMLKITAGDGAAGDNFGQCVDLDDNYIIVGAHNNDEAGDNAGAVYIYNLYKYAFNGGSGTRTDPFRISTPAQLDSVRNHMDDNFILANDIDLNVAPYNTGSGWKPIGDNPDMFFGSFNGAGYSIRNMYINRQSEDYTGLFGMIFEAAVDSLGCTNFDITGGTYVGGLVGSNCRSTLINCHVSGQITGSEMTGGLVGYNYYSLIFNSYSTSMVSGTNITGGLVGNNEFSNLSNCYATGSVKGDMIAGGLTGSNNLAKLIHCYATGGVSGNEYVGGVSGRNESSIISACYAAGPVSGNTQTGGLAGVSTASEIVDSYYNKESSKQETGIGSDDNSQIVIGLTTAEMKKESSFTGFNFEITWAIQADRTYPALQAINNAPFAFGCTTTGELSDLLENDYDFETLQQNLILKADSIVSLVSGKVFTHAVNDIEPGDSLMVMYRVGELQSQSGDTLWGNKACGFLNVPVINLEEPASIHFKLFPNPVQNDLMIESESLVLNVEIFSPNGRMLQSKNPGSRMANIDVQDLPHGTYIVHVRTDNGSIIRKFVKE